MLIRFKKTFEKIAMGLLSFMPSEKDIKRLLQTIKQYENDENWQLFLWKLEDDIIGLIGGVLTDGTTFTIHHVSVNPSYRKQGIGTKMVKEIKGFFPDKQVEASDEIKAFITKCIQEEGSN